MKILVSGASGFVGTHLVKHLVAKGYQVDTLVRSFSKLGKNTVFWDPDIGELKADDIEGYDVIINLAGDNIANGRWNDRKKAAILHSRVRSSKLLNETIQKLKQKPKLWINASAIGYYGDNGNTLVDEQSPCGKGFLAEVCQKWEEATVLDPSLNVQVVNLRIGMILGADGGALKTMLTPFRLGLGGVMGSGKQYISWIHIDDLVSMIEFITNSKNITGAINAVAPNPVDNYTFTKTLGEVLNKPTFMAMPAFAVKLIFGEMGKELLLSGSNVSAKKIEQAGFHFQYPLLTEALQNLLTK